MYAGSMRLLEDIGYLELHDVSGIGIENWLCYASSLKILGRRCWDKI
jgi:hypothetical protein